ncbi:HNH endonuclease signature motif containing protein [Bradyrhizobium sp. 33ap4]|uniref:HNH endonuclease signature motif containing protein n=1 Tax=Bradyrhizobium sp. 33ap4 TaxID=3061630 RepID=UPI00292DC1F4|nr:HNH endonuclease signature motif containing protein [Bradyrhizobium sp. 33ap4]
MPMRPPRICGCGRKVAAGVLCACQILRKAEAARRRPTASDRGYGTAWQKARSGFLASHPNCAMCGKPATVVDHINPHRGDKALFWDKSNWQPLCTHHHNSTKQAQER